MRATPASVPPVQAGGPTDRAAPAPRWRTLLLSMAALGLPLLATVLLHLMSLGERLPAGSAGALLTLVEATRVDSRALQLPVPTAGQAVRLPLNVPRAGAAPGTPAWVLARFRLERPADTTWALSFAHRTAAIVYFDGKLLANSVPLVEADLPPRNLQVGDRVLHVSVPADWLDEGAHEIAIRLGAPGPSGTTVSALTIGPAAAVDAADRPRRLWLALRLLTALSAVVIGTLLLFAWLVERREQLYLWSAVQLLMLALLLSPYLLSEPLLPSPWWRMLLDAADVVAKGLAPVVVASWAPVHAAWVRRLAFTYIALALPVDLIAASQLASWTDFSQPWPWWALGSRAAILALAVVTALIAMVERPGPQRFGTALLAGLALWIWADVSLFALVIPHMLRVVDLNVVAYAGWTLWVAVLLHQRLTHNRLVEQRLRDELADQLAQRSEQLRTQYAELQNAERARAAAAERERLLAEMHDGVGGQLTSARMLASSGELSRAQLVDILEDCLREMRLTVDALSITDGDLGLLLATLRSRLEPALRAGGLSLDWRVDATPLVPVLRGAGGREFARIVQEALSNVVHHAGASRIEIGTRLTADGAQVQVSVADDGRGMPEAISPGRGLRNMRQRAQRIAARIEWSRPPAPASGTILTIELPLGDAGVPRGPQ